MDGTAAIERNRVALARIVTSLAAMAGGNRQSGGASDAASKPPTPDCRLPTAAMLPRHLWVAILRLLRPAEAAARRLIIAAARGLVVPAPPPRRAGPRPATMEPLLRGLGIAVIVSPAGRARAGAILPCLRGRGTAEGGGGGGLEPGVPAFPLLDPLRRTSERRRLVPAHAAPRILLPGVIEPFRLPPPPSPDDPVSAERLGRRLAALAAALDDLPQQARRFARWKARLDRGLERRIAPLRGGPPPGGRLARYEPGHVAAGAQSRDAAGALRRSRDIREIDRILVHAHELALDALERPDTS